MWKFELNAFWLWRASFGDAYLLQAHLFAEDANEIFQLKMHLIKTSFVYSNASLIQTHKVDSNVTR